VRRGMSEWGAHSIVHVIPNRAASSTPRTASLLIRPYMILGAALGQLCRLVDPCETTHISTTFLLFGVRVKILSTIAEFMDGCPTALWLTFVVINYFPTIGGQACLSSIFLTARCISVAGRSSLEVCLSVLRKHGTGL
jgi:hypothetical protein